MSNITRGWVYENFNISMVQMLCQGGTEVHQEPKRRLRHQEFSDPIEQVLSPQLIFLIAAIRRPWSGRGHQCARTKDDVLSPIGVWPIYYWRPACFSTKVEVTIELGVSLCRTWSQWSWKHFSGLRSFEDWTKSYQIVQAVTCAQQISIYIRVHFTKSGTLISQWCSWLSGKHFAQLRWSSWRCLPSLCVTSI